MFEFCPQCGSPWSEIELEYQFCKECGYQSSDDRDCMWTSIRKRINILKELEGRSEELEGLIREQDHLLSLREADLSRVESDINNRFHELNGKAYNKKAKADKFEELFHSNFKKDFGSLFLAVGIIVKWGYLAFSFLMLTALTLGLFGIPIILILELDLAWWLSILVIIPFWLLGIGLLFHFFGKSPSNRSKQRIMKNETLFNETLDKRSEGFEGKTLRLMWLKARVAQMKKKEEGKNKNSSKPFNN